MLPATTKSPLEPTATKYHYSLRLNPPPLEPTTPCRTSVPSSVTHLSIDYSFLTDLCPRTATHPSLARITRRIAKHLKYLTSHCPSLKTFKLILLTQNCCSECHEDSLSKHFGYTKPGTSVQELSLVQKALNGLKVRDCFGVVVYLDRTMHRHPPPRYERGGSWRRELKQKAEVEIPEGSEEIGTAFGEGQMKVQEELERARDWPAVMAWWRWV